MTSTWREYEKEKIYPKLERDIAVDTIIIGGGMAGVLNAYQISQTGRSVALVESRELGTYATMDTTAFITEIIDSDLTQIASIFGERTAKLVWQSGAQAINEFEKIIDEEKIDCEFVRCSNYIFASTRKQFQALEGEHRMYKKLKLKAVLQKDSKTLGFPNYGYLEIPDQAKFHPSKFLYSLANRAAKKGVLIFENTEAKKIEGNGPFVVETSGGKITAQNVVVATYKPLTNEKTHLKKAMYRSYVFEVMVPKNMFQEALYEDQSNPYYYFRIDSQQKDHDRMIVGGEDHKDIFGKTLVKQSFESLKEFVAKTTQGRPYKIVNKWNGPILEPSDGLALIGEIKPHIYVASAFSGNGMTYSMISSLLIRDLISGRKNPWTKVYDPKRTLLHPKRLVSKAKDYVEEFWNGAVKNLLAR